MFSSVNILKTPGLYTLNECNVCYVNDISIKLFLKWNMISSKGFIFLKEVTYLQNRKELTKKFHNMQLLLNLPLTPTACPHSSESKRSPVLHHHGFYYLSWNSEILEVGSVLSHRG